MIETDKVKQAIQIGSALAFIERGCDMLCSATGDNDIDAGLKDAMKDVSVTAIDTLNLEEDGCANSDREWVVGVVEAAAKAVLKAGVFS